MAASVFVAAVIGWGVGSLTYNISKAGGQVQYAAAGAAAGAVVMVGALLLRKTSLASATVSHPLGDLTFVVARDKAEVAWQIFHEAARRVVAQPLKAEEGHLREALTSIYAWIQFSAELLRTEGPAKTAKPGARSVEHLWYEMYNGPVRSFQGYWHRALTEFEKTHPEVPESSWERDAEWRYELRELQRSLRPYLEGLAELAGVSEVERFLGASPQALPTPGSSHGNVPGARYARPTDAAGDPA
ncbi:hypothetical protein GCM10012285_41050 [Streptomyces kronopolitis]|uniref:DUF4760 domain-containing protein n=1 Tax=Streptomyces kronopolitis TaxID=1612435 RepID=A0ABQ2JPM5_9ACTN|nr:hypothetical protein GCM10012285_41050 [Streptomyces kronopolitis]